MLQKNSKPDPIANAGLTLTQQQSLASGWFRELRDSICAEFEKMEREFYEEARSADRASHQPAGGAPCENQEIFAGAFIKTPWSRDQGGGGEMSVMKGRVFEKVGVNISTVYGEFSEAFRKEIPGAADMPYFWASGISLVAHLCSPLVPAVHMNTRMICVGKNPFSDVSAAARTSPEPGSMEFSAENSGSDYKSWFGGGADLTPMYPVEQDTRDFHAAFETTCNQFDPDYYPKFKKWCDEYFFLKHRNEPRGIGGIFYDYLSPCNPHPNPLPERERESQAAPSHTTTSISQAEKKLTAPSPFQGEGRDEGKSWHELFAFTQEVGKTFKAIYPAIARRHMFKPWTAEQREWQLKKRGRYVEFNLLYDRGTRFGLMTGGNVDAILMSMPPEVKWP
jgi:coproporphyrinogen III oxidase